jgi:FixJ family two-component response regulator
MSSTANIQIAIVDDEDSLCRSMGRLLRAAGYQPATFPSAEVFLEDAQRERFDCLVLDIQLGGMSGLELHQKLLNTGSHTPVIFITAQDAPEMRRQAQVLGCAGFFRKTESGEVVLAAIRCAVNSHSMTLPS